MYNIWILSKSQSGISRDFPITSLQGNACNIFVIKKVSRCINSSTGVNMFNIWILNKKVASTSHCFLKNVYN